jgi:hypothetical protein
MQALNPRIAILESMSRIIDSQIDGLQGRETVNSERGMIGAANMNSYWSISSTLNVTSWDATGETTSPGRKLSASA